MKIVPIIIAGLIGIVLLVLLVRSRIAPTYSVTASEIPEVIIQLQRSAKDGYFAVLLFVSPGSTDREPINLQYSIEDGVVGFDWVLIGPRNVADKTKISEFSSKLGYRLAEHENPVGQFLAQHGAGRISRSRIPSQRTHDAARCVGDGRGKRHRVPGGQ